MATNVALVVSLVSVLLSVLSLSFAVYSWRQAHRPLVFARVTSVGGGNSGVALKLLVENTGNRPARDIQLIAGRAAVQAATIRGSIPIDAQRCFFSAVTIPVLGNGRSISNAFWHLGLTDSWRASAEFPILVKYQDLSGRRFSNEVRLLLVDDAGFAQTSWGNGNNEG